MAPCQIPSSSSLINSTVGTAIPHPYNLNMNLTITTAPPPESSSAKFHLVPLWLVIGFLMGAVPTLFCWLAVKLSRAIIQSRKQAIVSSDITVFSPVPTLAKKLDELFAQIDDGAAHLPSLPIIGRGGCGDVYRAELLVGDGDDDDVECRTSIAVAIKCIKQPAAGTTRLVEEESQLLNHKMRQIRSEIRTVGRMHHPNLLPLLAHVSRPNCHYLIYEFMERGSLHDALLEGKLPWLARHRIALGIAAGLDFLHAVRRPRVIHRDLKPANILIDEGLRARISDFGLAKMVAEGGSGDVHSRVVGTVGYIAPEYHRTLVCTDKCDMYSFGVILAVLVTGRFPTDRFFQDTEEMEMVGWIRSAMTSPEPWAVIDQRLLGHGFEEQMLLVLKIACFCTYDDPKARPNSREVRMMLAQIKL